MYSDESKKKLSFIPPLTAEVAMSPARKQVLWIDSHAGMLAELAVTVTVTREYDLDIADTISDAVRLLSTKTYDVVVTEIRVHQGASDPAWMQFYADMFVGQHIRHELRNKLGLCLLYSLFEPGRYVVPNSPPVGDWCTPDRFAVLTTEHPSIVVPHLTRLGIRVFKDKCIADSEQLLLDVIREVEKKRVTQLAIG